MRDLARAVALGLLSLVGASCHGAAGADGESAVVLQTLAAEPTIVRPGCTLRVWAEVSDPAAPVAFAWSTDKGAVVTAEGGSVTLRAPELEELSRLPSGFTVQVDVDAGLRGTARGAIGIVVDRRLGAPCEG